MLILILLIESPLLWPLSFFFFVMEELVNGGRRRFMLQADYRMGSVLDGCRGWKVPRLAAVVFHQFPHGPSRIHPVMNP